MESCRFVLKMDLCILLLLNRFMLHNIHCVVVELVNLLFVKIWVNIIFERKYDSYIRVVHLIILN